MRGAVSSFVVVSAVMATCLLVACDTAESPSESDGSSSGTDAVTGSSGEPGSTTGEPPGTSGTTGDPAATSTGAAETTTTGPVDCDGFAASEAFEIAPDGSTTRIHPHAVGDASGAWFTYVEPNPDGLFDVMALHLDCSLTEDVGPFGVSNADNDIDPSVAVSGDTVAVLWNSDNGQGGSDNLQIDIRFFGAGGATKADQFARMNTEVEGTTITDNHTNGVIVGTEDGFTVSGIRAHPDSPAFVAFAQDIDTNGSFIGEASSALIQEGVSNLSASAVPGWLGYGVSSDAGETVHVLASGEGVATIPFSDPSVLGVNLLLDGGLGSSPLVAASVGQDNALDVAVAIVGSPAEPLRLGGAGTIEHNPILAAGPGGTLAMVFHRNVSGLNNEVVFQRLSIDGDAVLPGGDPMVLDDMSPPYPPSITSVGDGLWLVTWARGTSPEFTTWGQVVE